MTRSVPVRTSEARENRATWRGIVAAAALTGVSAGLALAKDEKGGQDEVEVAPSFRSAFQRVLPAVCKIAASGSSSPSWFGRATGPSASIFQ